MSYYFFYYEYSYFLYFIDDVICFRNVIKDEQERISAATLEF